VRDIQKIPVSPDVSKIKTEYCNFVPRLQLFLLNFNFIFAYLYPVTSLVMVHYGLKTQTSTTAGCSVTGEA